MPTGSDGDEGRVGYARNPVLCATRSPAVARLQAFSSLGLAAVLGCAPEELPLPPVVWEGQTVRARMDDPGIQVCGGTFEALDRQPGEYFLRLTRPISDDDGHFEIVFAPP